MKNKMTEEQPMDINPFINLLKEITELENSIISEYKIKDKETHNELTIKVQFPKLKNK